VEVSVLGHFLPNSILAIKDTINFIQQVPLFSKASARGLLTEMANASISVHALHREFFMVETLRNGQSTQTVW